MTEKFFRLHAACVCAIRLAANVHQLGADDALHEIARQIDIAMRLWKRLNLDTLSLREADECIDQISIQIEHLGFKSARSCSEILVHSQGGTHFGSPD